MTRSISVLAAVLAAILLVPSLSRAQSSTTGAIAGAARDATGAVLPGVTVEAASPALIEKVRTAVTDDSGNYKIVDLRPGTYTVTFTLPGFSTYKREGLDVSTGVTVPANAEMKVGGLEETVTVTGASPVVDVQNTRNQNVLKQEVLEALPIGRTNAGFAELTLGAASINAGAAVIDQGGSKGDSTQRLTVHGLRAFDQRIYYDGMYQQNLLSSGKNWQTNQMAVQEVIVNTATGSGEVETAGLQMNYVPKDGGNTYRGTINGNGTTHGLQAKNISDEIRSFNVTQGQEVKRIYDFGIGIGGPIAKDKLWFYTAHRFWGTQEYQPGGYYNKSPTPFAYVPDTTRQSYTEHYAQDYGARLAWQATAKQKVSFDYHLQRSCQCYLLLSATQTPEASPRINTFPAQQFITSWSNPVSNRLLLEAGVSYFRLVYKNTHDDQYPNAVRIQDTVLGVTYAAGAVGLQSLRGNSRQPNVHQRASASYVIGSHAFKIGEQWLDGFYNYYQEVNQGLWYTFNSGRPASIAQWALPVTWRNRIRNIGLYAQDQWTMSRLTLNLGVRYDGYHGWVPAGTRQASLFTPAFSFDKVDNVPNFKDVSPRIGAAYDVFGNGKTAVKGAIGRYVGALGVEFQDANNPAFALTVVSASRTWNDTTTFPAGDPRNGNFVPDCVLTNFAANGECTQLNNAAFGTQVRSTFYDPSVTEGWFNRAYGWQGTVAVQQELAPGVGLNVAYFRTWYGNFSVTKNELTTPADYNTYCVTAPSDSKLPNGGGNQICGFYEVSRAKFGQSRSLATNAGQFGKQKEQFDGVDVALAARAGKGVLNGGVSFGRSQTDNCYLNARPDIGAGSPRTEAYCHVVPPWMANTQIKANGFYPLPWWGLEPSFTFQNLPGAQITATRATPNAEIAPSLGRNLNSCPVTGACPATVTASVALIPPQTKFLDRVNTLNLGIAKNIRVGRWRTKATVDVFNVFNTSAILNVNNTYGPSWQRPVTLIGGRLVKFSGQLDF